MANEPKHLAAQLAKPVTPRVVGKYYVADFSDNEYFKGKRFATPHEARKHAKTIPANEHGVFVQRNDGDYLHTVSNPIDRSPKGYVHDVVPPKVK